jgi:Putative beta-barrel porin-2, OmpL-like. bbp2
MRDRWVRVACIGLVICLGGEGAARADALPAAPPSLSKPLPTDLEAGPAPWGTNASWMNGEQRPAPTLIAGPAVVSLYLDTYYAYDVNNPVDHTSFFNSVAPRHNEINVNLASAGVNVALPEGPYGRLYLQYGTMAAATIGRDGTTARGSYLSATTMDAIREAAVGWHFDYLDGTNIEAGLLPSYLSPDSYLPGENWYYSRPFLSEFTPHYLMAIRVQFRMHRSDFEIWFSNGWQTLGEWHATTQGQTDKNDNLEYGSYGTYWNWRPSDSLSVSDATYAAASSSIDPAAIRVFNATTIQARYVEGGGAIRRAAVSLAGDIGYEFRDPAHSGAMGGVVLANRLEFGSWAWTVRGDFYSDKTQALVVPLPTGYPLEPGAFTGFGVGTNLDLKPNSWFLARLDWEYRSTNIPYLAGSAGITGPGGFPNGTPATPDLQKNDLRAILNATVAF